MWTFEQWVHLLSVLAWPAVAFITSWAFLRGCEILSDSCRETEVSRAYSIKLVADRLVWGALRIDANSRPHYAKPGDAELVPMCERALLAILAANGGIPASREEKAARALVREIREMYAEIENPTEAPPSKPRANSLDYDDLDPDLDEETADHVYAQFATDELDVQDEGDVPGRQDGEL